MADHYQTGVKMSFRGKLLVAGPILNANPVFTRAVVYIYEQRDDGSVIGVILNKPSEFKCSSLGLLKDIPFDPALDETFVHKGGPVSETSVLLLHTNEWQSTNTLQSGELAMTSDMLMIEKLSTGNTPKGWRMFAGMSIWTEQQLAREIQERAWLVLDKPSNHSIFDYNGDEQYLKAVDLCSKQTFSKYL